MDSPSPANGGAPWEAAPPRPDTEAPDALQSLRDRRLKRLEESARLFRVVLETARRSGRTGFVARLERLADAADARLAQVRQREQALAAARATVQVPHRATRAARVLVADQHELAREALTGILARDLGLEVVGEASDGEEAVQLARRLQPDLVLMEVRMPLLDGIEATRAILRQRPGTKVVLLTSHESRALVQAALRAGAVGYVLKGASRTEALALIRGVLEGETRVQADLAARLLAEDPGGSDTLARTLSHRELEVLHRLSYGMTNEQIARDLVVSANTVKTHVTHVLRKLGVSDRVSAVARGVVLGLLNPSDLR